MTAGPDAKALLAGNVPHVLREYALLADGSREEVFNAGLPTHVAKETDDGRQVVMPPRQRAVVALR